MPESIASRIVEVKKNIHLHLEKNGRGAEETALILVSKTVDVQKISEAYRAGIRDFGENKVQEFLEKKKQLPADIRWHLIGHIQTNKVKAFFLAAVDSELPLIHSLDRQALADEIEKQARKWNLKKVPCLIQVNYSGETTKGGFAPQDVEAFVRKIPSDSAIALKGLMTIGPHTDEEQSIRNCFRGMKGLFEQLRNDFPEHPWQILSMGMSHDYLIGVDEGATMVRVGQAVFGKRTYVS
ncbi:MAG: YggS family pyridoxal phosphate-dependent enzyme [Candidatus Omnitrophica bacterium]|nr:YggS family pyridoxal phosphate-dependent enzyme [Candidatus Omnitrophota bacterium]